jgi:nucleoside-diphosphate-sugar epimerase
MGERVGITGGGGFIGTALARRLRAEGHEVRGVDVTDAGAGAYADIGAELVRGDVCDPTSMAAFCEGLDTVIHTAAVVQESGEWDRFRRVNVDGPRTVATAARAAGARRLVHLSSVMVYGFDFPDRITEDGPLDGADNPYCQTKIESEAAVLALHDPGTFDVHIVRPGDVYGPGSVPWTIRPVTLLRQGLWANLDGGEPIQNHVYIDNVVDGILLVLERGAPGEAYVITDDVRTTTGAFFGRYAAMLGVDVPDLAAADAVAMGVDPEAVRYMTRRATYSCEKVKALGYVPAVDLDEGMSRTRAWLEEAGLLG